VRNGVDIRVPPDQLPVIATSQSEVVRLVKTDGSDPTVVSGQLNDRFPCPFPTPDAIILRGKKGKSAARVEAASDERTRVFVLFGNVRFGRIGDVHVG
jgi:hypothetical protein